MVENPSSTSNVNIQAPASAVNDIKAAGAYSSKDYRSVAVRGKTKYRPKLKDFFKQPAVPMGHQIYQYSRWLEERLAKDDFDSVEEIETLYTGHLVKIQFYQHERLIHLIVMSLMAVLTTLVLLGYLVTKEPACALCGAIMLCLLIAYIFYYFWIENSVQALYLMQEQLVNLGKEHDVYL